MRTQLTVMNQNISLSFARTKFPGIGAFSSKAIFDSRKLWQKSKIVHGVHVYYLRCRQHRLVVYPLAGLRHHTRRVDPNQGQIKGSEGGLFVLLETTRSTVV